MVQSTNRVEVGGSFSPADAPIYFFDIVEDYPEIGGVTAVSRRLREALAARLGRRLVAVSGIAASLGCGDPAEPYLPRERRAIERLAARDPSATFLVPNFQNPLARTGRRPRPRIINIVHDVQFAHLPHLFTDEQRAWLGAAYAETRANADAIAFVSDATRDGFAALFGAPAKSVVIPAPMGSSLAEDGAAPRPAEPFLLAVQHGHHHPHKNVDGLLRLFSGLAGRFPELLLVVAGRGDAAFRQACGRLPAALQARVEHRGYVPRRELTALYRGAAAFVSLSRFEGFNLPAAEAASCGAPLILSDLPVHRDLHAGVACLLDPCAPDIDRAARYLAQEARAVRGYLWPHAAACSAEAVGLAHAELLAEVGVAPRARTSWRLSSTTQVFRVGSGRGRRGPGETRARAQVRRQRLARMLLAGTMLGGSATLGTLMGAAPGKAAQAACAATAVNAPGGAGGASSDGVPNGGGAGTPSGLTGGDGTEAASGYYGGGGGGAGGDCVGPAGGAGGRSNNTAGGANSANGGAAPSSGDYYSGGGGGGGGYYGGTLTDTGPGNGFTGGTGQTGGAGDTSAGRSGGGGGGGGGGLGTALLSGTAELHSSSLGGDGGAGGSAVSGAGGAGGAGGIGTAVFNGSVLIIGGGVSTTGGKGGAGGDTDRGPAGAGGAGGIGLLFGAGGLLTNDGTIAGGDGGRAGVSGQGAFPPPAAGLGGAGIVGSDIRIVTTGPISGGLSGDGTVQANAITFTGGVNTLSLETGFSLKGDIAVTGTLIFGQDVTAEVTNVAGSGTTAITGSGSVIKTGAGTLILSGANSYRGGTTIDQGTLQVGAVPGTLTSMSLGTGSVLLNGGTLQAAARNGSNDGFSLGNPVAVGAAGGVVDLNGNDLTLTGPIANGATVPGVLTFANSAGGGPTLTLLGTNSFTGGVEIANGASVQSGSTNALGTGTLQVDQRGAFFMGGYDQSVTRLAGTGTIANGGNFATETTGVLTVQSGSFGGLLEDGTSSSGARGITALTKVSDGSASGGTLTLSGQSAYSGDTTVAGGTLQAGSTAGFADHSAYAIAAGAELDLGGFSNSVRALSGQGLVTNSGSGPAVLTVGTIGDTSSAFDGTLADGTSPLGLTKAGAGTLILTGTNSFTGGTTVAGGTLQIGNGGTAGSIAGDVTDNATLAFARSDTLAYGGTISGSGGLSQLGPGTLNLTGASTYVGPTAVQAGRLAVNGSLGNTAVTVASGATLGGSGTIAGGVTIADGGILAPGNSPGTITVGSLTLTPGANGSSGSVLAYELGTVAAGNGQTSDLTNVTGNLVLAGTLNASDAGGFTYGSYRIFNYGGTLTNDGLAVGSLPTGFTGVVQTAIPNQVNLVVASPATPLQFWDGALAIGNGTIAGGSGTWTNALTNWTDPNGVNNAAWGRGVGIFSGAAGTVTVADTIAFQGLQFATDGYTLVSAAGGTLVPTAQAFVRVAAGDTATIAAPLTGAGGLEKLSNGTLVLTGTNTYTGGTTVAEGTLQLGNGGTTGSVLGNIADNAALVFDRADPVTYGGAISGSGTLSQAGTGTLTLTGANTFTGATTIAPGTTLALAGPGSIAGSSNLVDGGTFDISQGSGASIVSLGGSGIVTLGSQTLTLTAASSTFVGAVGGTGRLVVLSGTEVLAGANTYTGGTTITGGTLQIGNGGTTGSIVGDVSDLGILAFARSDAFTYGGTISGGGQVVQNGPGTLTLTGANSYVGGTAVDGGTLALGNSAALGTGRLALADGTTLQAAADRLRVANPTSIGGTATIDTQGFALALTGPISGAGKLDKTGVGTLTLTGANTYTGGTLLEAGRLDIADARALGTGRLALDAGTTLAFGADLTLGNATRFTGTADPTIDTGIHTDTLSGTVSGPGALTKTGSGTLILTGTDPYTGATTVAAGTLEIDGSIAASVTTVNGGATLSGTGTVGSIAARNGATVAPGSASNPYGVLYTPGSAAFFAGSTYRVNISPTGQTSALAVTGPASLAGAAVTVGSAPGTYDLATRYTILTATGGVQGRFGSLSTATALAFLNPTLSYSANAVTLAFQSNGISVTDVAVTPNERSVAAAIQSLDQNATVVRSLQGLALAQARVALDQLAGASHASVATIAAQDSLRVSTQILDRLWNIGGGDIDARTLLQRLGTPGELPAFVNCYAPLPAPATRAPPSVVTAWGEGFGDFGRDGQDRNLAGLDRSLGGFIVGYDAPLHGLGAPYRVGIAGGYTNTSFTGLGSGGSGSNGTFESVFGSIYGGARYGAVDLRGGITVAGTSTTLDRTVAYPGFSEGEHSVYGGNTEQLFAEAGYRFSGTRWVVEPVLNAAYTHVHQDAFRERGGAAALAGYAQDDDVGTTTLGARAEYAPFVGMPLVGRAFLGWRHGFGDIDPATKLAFEAGSLPFTAQGAAIDRNALASEVGLDWRYSASMTLGLAYTGQIGARDSDNGVKGRLEYKF